MIITKRRKTKSDKLADELRKYIQRGSFAPDTLIAPSRELAAEFQVPLSTVNRAIRTLADEGWLYRLQGSGTYVKNAAPESSSTKLWQIGFYDLIGQPSITPEFHILRELYEQLILAEFSKYDCKLHHFGFEDLKSEKHCREMFSSFDAIFVSAALIDTFTLKNLYSANCPILIFNGMTLYEFPALQVLSDWTWGIQQVVEQIDLKKFDKYLLLNISSYATKNIITGGFRQQISYKGVKAEQIEEIQIQPCSNFSEQLAGYKFGRNADVNERTFIFCVSDFAAFGILEAWRERKIPVGKYSLVGCFNMEGHGVKPFAESLVTSINHDKEELVRRSVQLLISTLENHENFSTVIKVPSQLIIRKSAFA